MKVLCMRELVASLNIVKSCTGRHDAFQGLRKIKELFLFNLWNGTDCNKWHVFKKNYLENNRVPYGAFIPMPSINYPR